MSFTWWLYPVRRFDAGGARCEVRSRARSDGLYSMLTVGGIEMAHDVTPLGGEMALRNHRLTGLLPTGQAIEVELGYRGAWTTGIIARIDGQIVHESHPGMVIGYPEKYRDAALELGDLMVGRHMKESAMDGRTESGVAEQGMFARQNRIPFAVDVATGLLFFAVAKLTDLTTAALVGAAVGIGLVVFQRITRIDVTGGLALFGIVMLLISAGLALVFQDEEWVKLRGTITGSIAAVAFLGDALLFRGRLLAGALKRYLPYDDLDVTRLGLGIGGMGLIMAWLNYGVAKLASTDIWLFYSTFLDIFITMALMVMVIQWARRPG